MMNCKHTSKILLSSLLLISLILSINTFLTTDRLYAETETNQPANVTTITTTVWSFITLTVTTTYTPPLVTTASIFALGAIIGFTAASLIFLLLREREVSASKPSGKKVVKRK